MIKRQMRLHGNLHDSNKKICKQGTLKTKRNEKNS